MTTKIDDVLGAYLLIKKEKEAVATRHKEELAPFTEKLNALLAWVQAQLQTQGLKNFRGESGIAFLQTDTAVTAKDWEATLQWIRDNNAWEFLERRISKSVVQDYIESHGDIPPGIQVTQEVSAHIRKG